MNGLTKWIALCSVCVLFITGCSKLDDVIINTEYDFLYHLDSAEFKGVAVHPEWATMSDSVLGERTYWGIFEHAEGKIDFQNVYVGNNAVLEFKIGMLQDSWTKGGDGVRFEIDVVLENGRRLNCFSKYIDPKNNPEDRKWHDERVDLEQIQNQRVTFTFSTYSGKDGNSKNNESDWAIWGAPILRSSGKKDSHKNSNEKNIILITIDTCRADYLGCYGNDWIETPHIDRLANEGVLFENLFAASSTTSPSHVSILTSLQPYQHEVITNGIKLAGATPILSQFMKENGYATGASISVFHLIDLYSGLGKWFDFFDHRHIKWLDHGKELSLATRGGRASTSGAIHWLERVHNKPFFLWLHYYDPHAPYFAEGDFHKKYYPGNPKSQSHQSMKDAIFHKGFENAFAWTAPYTDLEYFQKEYGAEISFVDAQLGRLMDALKRLHVDKNTMIVITADHGENLGDHEIYFDHTTLYNTDVNVPLIIWYPKSLPKGKRISTPVAHIDIAPTLLEFIGDDDNFNAGKMFDGRSLKPLWENNYQDENRIITSNGLLYTRIAGWDNHYKVIWELRDTVYHDKSKTQMDRVWIFDRSNDKAEINPIGCFYWGDDSERDSFKINRSIEMQKIVKSATEDRSLEVRMSLMKDWLCKKQVPSQNTIRERLISGAHGIKLNDSYANDPTFIPTIHAILQELKKGVCPPALQSRLQELPENAALDSSQLRSMPVYDDTLQETLKSLGYGGEEKDK